VSDPQSEFVERYAPRGPRGEQGKPGSKGERGVEGALPQRARRSLVIRDCVIIVLLLLNFVFTARYVNSTQAGQRRAGLLTEQKICTDVGSMAQIPAPAGNPATNPSRAYEQAEQRTWRGLFRGLDCSQIP
jgi:hypothetical protein